MIALRKTSRPRTLLALAAVGVAALQYSPDTAARAVIPNDRHAVVHALNRLGFGARPGDVERVEKMGLAAWIDQQLRPERIAERGLGERLSRFETLTLDSQTIAEEYVLPARLERRARQQSAQTRQGQQTPNVAPMTDAARKNRQVFTELSEAKLLRAIYSERQLEEVLVDFWFNHFNVFARKGQTEIYIGEYEREAIRPYVLGNFRELLEATAKSPAMLFYLDNWMSADPNAMERVGPDRRPRRGALPQAQPLDRAPNRRARGLNENYARELLELHTLGVDGGYTQQDVVEVARAFTGWTIDRPTAGFRFVPMMHDRGAKTVLGHQIRAGGGIEDGEKVLDIVASHPSTAQHIALKLAQRFVSDSPPQSVVDKAAATFRTTKGDLRAVVRVIVTSSEFFAPETYRAKVKTPFEFVVSALRATGANVQSAVPVVRALVGLGMPLYLCQPPTGYDDTADVWISSGALVNRMNFALAIASGEMRGVQIPGATEREAATARDRIIRDALAGDVSAATLDTIVKATTSEETIALTIGSPEFQRQ